MVAVAGRAKEDDLTDWKAEAVLAHEIANRVVAWEKFIVDAFLFDKTNVWEWRVVVL
jgi:hypothetical protein